MKYSCKINLDVDYCSYIDTIHIKNNIIYNLLPVDKQSITYELRICDRDDNVDLYSSEELIDLRDKINDVVERCKAIIYSGNYNFMFYTDDIKLYSKIKLLVGV